MIIHTKKTGAYVRVSLEYNNVNIDMGLLDDNERNELAKTLVEGLWAMGPSMNIDCASWVKEIFADCNIELDIDKDGKG